MCNFRFSDFLLYSIAFLFLGLISSPLMGQGLFVEKAESTVEIKQDNLVRAKAEALKEAKGKLIMKAVSRFLDFESMIYLKPLLIQHFFEHPDIYIESIRVISERNTKELSEFTLKIETRIFHSRLLSAFRELGLVTRQERIPFKSFYLIYDADSKLRQRSDLNEFLDQLNNRLKPYRIRIKIILPKVQEIPIETGLPARLALLPLKTTEKRSGTDLAFLELKLGLSHQSENSPRGELKAKLIFWSQKKKILDSQFSTSMATAKVSYKTWNTKEILTNILDELILKWTPVMQHIVSVNQENGTLVNLKFQGLPGPIEEQKLIKALFWNNPRWKELTLDTISRNYVSYKALFLGPQKEILQDFRLLKNEPFRISSVNLEDNNLVVRVKWNEVPVPLELFTTTLTEAGFSEINLEENYIPKPAYQVPSNTFKQTFKLPFAKAVYDHIRHRGDSTLFRIEIPKHIKNNEGNRLINLTWFRLSPTHLNPEITIFDQNRNRKKSFLMRRLKKFSFQYKIPIGQENFYIRISDEVGFLKGISGSYQSFHYILASN